MKTFREFMVIVEDKMTERLSKMSNDEFEDFLKGRQPEEVKSFRAKRAKVPGSTFTNNKKSQSLPGKPSTNVTKLLPPTTKPTKAPTNALKGLKTGAALGGVVDTALEKSKGSGWARSLAKGTASALGGLAGGALGSAAGPVGTFAGGAAGSMAAGKAFDVAAGANAKERAAMRQQKRQSQEGGALKGIGGKTTFDTKKGTMTTGSGKQQKTVQLAKTSVVKDPKTGKAEVGHLAYKDGKAVYKRADTSNAALAKTSSNPLERIGRTLFSGAYKQHDAKQKAAKIKQAAQSDIKRQQALGVKGSKNLVGPKIVGPKIVGPAKPSTPPKKQSL